MFRVQIQTKLDKQIALFIKSLIFKKPLKDSINLLKKEVQQNFEQEGRIYGLWRPLADSTRIQRTKLGFGRARPILYRTGKLKRGFKTSSDSKKAEIINTVSYAKYHELGTRRIPKRKILGTSSKSRKAIGLIFTNFIKDQIKKHL